MNIQYNKKMLSCDLKCKLHASYGTSTATITNGIISNLSNYDASIYAQEILRLRGRYLNMLDGYSMAFRLVHDLGLIPFLILIFAILKNALTRMKSIKNNFIKEEVGKFYFIMGFTF